MHRPGTVPGGRCIFSLSPQSCDEATVVFFILHMGPEVNMHTTSPVAEPEFQPGSFGVGLTPKPVF